MSTDVKVSVETHWSPFVLMKMRRKTQRDQMYAEVRVRQALDIIEHSIDTHYRGEHMQRELVDPASEIEAPSELTLALYKTLRQEMNRLLQLRSN